MPPRIHGTPDLSRRAWASIFGEEVTVSAPFRDLTANPDAAGARDWPLLDSLGQPMGRLQQDAKGRVQIAAVDGQAYKVVAMNVRGHGCAADPAQMTGSTLVQLIAPKAPSHGTQAFLDLRAIADPAAAAAFTGQLGGGTGCAPAGTPRGRQRPLADPAVGATAHARLSSGALNTVTEYDAKPAFGGTVYFMSNTTSVRVGGVTRGMVRIGTPVVTVDKFPPLRPEQRRYPHLALRRDRDRPRGQPLALRLDPDTLPRPTAIVTTKAESAPDPPSPRALDCVAG